MKLKDYRDIDIIWEYQNRIARVTESNKLDSIAGTDSKFEIYGQNVLKLYFEVTGSGLELYRKEAGETGKEFEQHKLFDDLRWISNEVLHFSGLMLLHSEHMNSPLDNKIHFKNGNVVYANIMGLSDVRFYMYLAATLEKIYNFWDRIGDLLAVYFPECFKKKDLVYFAKIDNFIPEKYHKNKDLAWLIEFKNGEFRSLNRIRKSVVHNEGISTSYKHQHLENVDDVESIEILIQSRKEFISLIKKNVDLSLEGFYRTLKAIEFINEEILTDPVQVKLKRDIIIDKPED